MKFRPELKIKHYLLINAIAEGGMGVVWRAWDEKVKQFVAIKAVSNTLLGDSQFKFRFHDEINRHTRLDHPNIVKILDAFDYEDSSCCVMAYIEGISLEDLIDQAPCHCLDIALVERIARDILDALNYAHRQGIIHRDIKPSNILLDKQGNAHLIDFGIALAIGEKRRTKTGQTVGTPFYMSPEQIKTPKQITHLADVYSLGCVLYEALTGRPPFTGASDQRGNTYFDVRQAHVYENIIPPKQIRSSIPVYLNDLIVSALEKEPEKRPSGCGEFMLKLANKGQMRRSWPSEWIRKYWPWLFSIAFLSSMTVIFTIIER